MQDDKDTTVADIVDNWREQVLDLSRRNNLVNFEETQTKSLPLVADPAVVAEQLLREGELTLRKQSEEPPVVDREPETAAESLTEISHHQRQYLRERGVDTLFLSFGHLKWKPEESAEHSLDSPLFLLPVDIEQQAANGPDAHDYSVTYSGDPMQLNPALRKKMAVERGIDLPADESLILGSIDDAFNTVAETASAFTTWSVTRSVTLCIFDFNNISLYEDIERNRAAFIEDPFVRSIAGDFEATENVTDSNKQSANIATDRSQQETSTEDGTDQVLESDSPYQVLEADPTQRRAIDAAVQGESFVLQGPPGTGKSQTIANIIAEKLGRDESVLFVSEKQAALDVVRDRLTSVGLGQFCLEVHGQKASHESVLSALQSVEHSDSPPKPVESNAARQRRDDVADSLDAYADLLTDAPDKFDVTVFEALGTVSQLRDHPDFEAGIDNPLDANQDTLDEAVQALEELATYEDPIRNIESHPWRHTTLVDWRVDTAARMRRTINQQLDALNELESIADRLDARLGIQLTRPEDIDAAMSVLETYAFIPTDKWSPLLFDETFLKGPVTRLAEAQVEAAQLKSELQERYEPTMFDEKGAVVHQQLSTYGVFRYVRPSYYSLKRNLTSHTQSGYDPVFEELQCDARDLRRLQTLQQTIKEIEIDSRYVEPFDDGTGVDWDLLLGVRDYLESLVAKPCCHPVNTQVTRDDLAQVCELHQELQAAKESLIEARAFFKESMAVSDIVLGDRRFVSAPIDEQQGYLEHLRSNLDRLPDWVHFQRCRSKVAKTIADHYMRSFLESDAEPSLLVDGFRREFFRAWLNELYEQTPLSSFSRSEFEHYVETYRSADRDVIDDASDIVQQAVSNRQSDHSTSGPQSDQDVVLRRELRKHRHQRPLRELFADAGDAIKQRKPCFMMSPQMVARCLEYGEISFDTVVFDEASQIPPSKAASALLRADQVIVAGDSKQLPPTRFFQTDIDTETNLESILDEASAVFPTRHLSWHYRSRSASLIQFSNEQYYDGRLRTFPQRTEKDSTALSFEYVSDGVYHRGESRTNPIEAARVADVVTKHAETTPETSLGVVAFSRAQERAIREELEDRRSDNPELDRFLARDDVQEEFFVKSLEVVQGDERDRIVFSVGYGPDEEGDLTMQFGPLNQSGGHRRLNVAITRAREQVTVVSSIKPEEITASATDCRGVTDFKRYLTYVRDVDGRDGKHEPTQAAEFDTPLVTDVYETLTSSGFCVDTDIGGAGYTFDMAVCDPDDPERHLLGIEVDGTIQHHCSSTRERDRLRQQVLAERGWPIHRIWAPSWATDTERAVDRIHDRIEQLTKATSVSAQTVDDSRYSKRAEPDGGKE